MKKLILLAFLGLSISGFSQIRFYGQVGMTISTFDRDLMQEYGFIEYRQFLIDEGVNASSPATNSVRPGGMIGLEMDILLDKTSFVKTGIKYTNGGDGYFFKTPDIQYQQYYGLVSTDARFKFRPRLDYIAVPVNYGKILGDFSVYGGVTPHINVASALRVNYFEVDNPSRVQEKWEREDDLLTAANNVYFLNVGANYIAPAFDLDYVMSLNFSYSLNPVYDHPGAVAQINSAHLWLIELAFGFTISTEELR
ncbi:hypothetical protein SAMN05421640_0209 [Ekhidna lutea]|uniref:Outer membrane protein beta-barrel domain-containing protein n=1 Tax=Ekhidna lutea TaxID=447679 RepID=A0A239EL47_EKHLU|nr:hypothetical protein [Ekhidna lutea]SNS45289.1 hypothetical protein SAMN05421640_0209 [Ekhidna lutea]